jgi:hypothetical protein
MTEDRNQLLQRMSRAAYEYAIERQHANWENKRPELQYQPAAGLSIASCGAFRAWKILAHDGVIGWCVDAYRQRETENETGGVVVLIGDGSFVFPLDSSCSTHSLSFGTSGNANLIPVTDSPEVPWEPRIEAMATELEAATARLRDAVKAYDDNARLTQSLKRSAEISAAVQALQSTKGTP